MSRLGAKSRVHEVFARDMLFADDAVLVTHFEDQVKRLMGRFSKAYQDFSLTISVKKTNATSYQNQQLQTRGGP